MKPVHGLLEQRAMMETVGPPLIWLLGVGNAACYVIVLVKMFRHNQANVGIACILLGFCLGIGGLVAFIYGWVKALEWGITKVMTVWTVLIALILILLVLQPDLFQQPRVGIGR
jgi:CHASE2 domain-containing sensor protein